jgi:uncharacterized protein
VQLTEHLPGDHHVIRSVDRTGIVVDAEHYSSSLIVGARLLIDDWPVRHLEDLDDERIAALIEHGPEVVILGIGERQHIATPELQRDFYRRGIGLECMTLAAACRTFNVLMSENRRAIAGLILPAVGAGE